MKKAKEKNWAPILGGVALKMAPPRGEMKTVFFRVSPTTPPSLLNLGGGGGGV